MAKAQKYTVLVGCNYPPDNTRAEAGDVIEVPGLVAAELLQLGAVEPVVDTVARERAAQRALLGVQEAVAADERTEAGEQL